MNKRIANQTGPYNVCCRSLVKIVCGECYSKICRTTVCMMMMMMMMIIIIIIIIIIITIIIAGRLYRPTVDPFDADDSISAIFLLPVKAYVT